MRQKQFIYVQAQQIAACNARHDVSQQLARYLSGTQAMSGQAIVECRRLAL